MELLIKNACIVDYSKNITGDIYIKDGIISEISKNIKKDCPVIDADGLTVLPAFVDSHAHFRDPGYTYKEDIFSGGRAASKGGYTAVNLMANTKPVCSSMDVVNYVLEKCSKTGLVDAHQCVSITRDFEGKDVTHLKSIDTSKVKIISEDGFDVMDDNVMEKAMDIAKEMGLIVMTHCENKNAINSRISENTMTKRNVDLAEKTGCSLHVAHVSTKEAESYIKDAKSRGIKVTCEVTPHHISLTGDANYKVNPPLREKEDIEVLIQGIKDGTVDMIGTDHAPHSKEDKEKGANGISGIETSFPVVYTNLVVKNNITLNKVSELMSKSPSDMLGFNKGRIETGYDGDIVIVDLNCRYEINASKFYSKGKNTPFDGSSVYGKIIYTIKSGKITYKEGEN